MTPLIWFPDATAHQRWWELRSSFRSQVTLLSRIYLFVHRIQPVRWWINGALEVGSRVRVVPGRDTVNISHVSDVEIEHRVLLLFPVILRNISRPVQMILIENSPASKDRSYSKPTILADSTSRDRCIEEVVHSIFFAALMTPHHHHKLLLLLSLFLPELSCLDYLAATPLSSVSVLWGRYVLQDALNIDASSVLCIASFSPWSPLYSVHVPLPYWTSRLLVLLLCYNHRLIVFASKLIGDGWVAQVGVVLRG